MVKTYVLAPNWTTAPPPDGPVKLGHVLDDLAELVPLNRDIVVDTSKLLNRADTKSGFTTSRGRLISGELGFFARVFGLVGVGVGADAQYTRDQNDVLSCTALDTETFDPTDDYIRETMEIPDIKRFMKNGKYKEPVYMFTGLKIGRGGCLESSNSREGMMKLEGGLMPQGSPAEIGGKTGVTVRKTGGESWERSTDFIVAFRVRKIWYHHGEIQHKTNKDKVVMQDGTSPRDKQDLFLQTDDDVTLDDINTTAELVVTKDLEDGDEVKWILPNKGTGKDSIPLTA